MLPAPIPVTFTVTLKTPDIVYLHECANDCSVQPGADNAIDHTSSEASQAATLEPFPYSDDVFVQVAACTRSVLAPFDIHVITNNPGPVARREIMFTTNSSQIYTGGYPFVAPTLYPTQDNVIGFVFATYAGNSSNLICWYSATAIAHLYSLDPVFSGCPDIMDQSTGCGERSFVDEAFLCDNGGCADGQTTQNSFEMLRAGAGTPEFIFTNSFEAFEVPSPGPSP